MRRSKPEAQHCQRARTGVDDSGVVMGKIKAVSRQAPSITGKTINPSRARTTS